MPEDAGAIAVVGSGYVGTVVAACFAVLDRVVVAVETDEARLEALSRGQVSFYREVSELIAAPNAYDAAEQADAVVIATQWPEFSGLDFHKLRTRMRGNTILDGRNCVDANSVIASGLDYHGIGRPARSRRGPLW